MKTALGLIETKGLVAAIAAADKALKSANVNLEGKDITEPGYVTIRFTGELAEIQIAVAAGAEAARDTGELISSIVIAEPNSQLSVLFKSHSEKVYPTEEIFTFPAPSPKGEGRGDVRNLEPAKQIILSSPPPLQIEDQGKVKLAEVAKKKVTHIASPAADVKRLNETKKSEPVSKSFSTPSPSPSEGEGRDEMEVKKHKSLDTITRLRLEALGNMVDSKTETFIVKETDGQDLAELNVHQLRKLARSTPDFPIFGRKISKANRDELLKLFNGLGH